MHSFGISHYYLQFLYIFVTHLSLIIVFEVILITLIMLNLLNVIIIYKNWEILHKFLTVLNSVERDIAMWSYFFRLYLVSVLSIWFERRWFYSDAHSCLKYCTEVSPEVILHQWVAKWPLCWCNLNKKPHLILMWNKIWCDIVNIGKDRNFWILICGLIYINHWNEICLLLFFLNNKFKVNNITT